MSSTLTAERAVPSLLRRYSPLSSRTSSQNIWFGNMKEIKYFDNSWENLVIILCSMYKYSTIQVVENYIYYFSGNV